MAMMGVWDTPRMNTDDFLSGLNPRVMEDNPTAELLKGLLEGWIGEKDHFLGSGVMTGMVIGGRHG